MKRLIFFFALISSQAFGQIRNSGNVLQSLIADTTIDLYLEADRGLLNKAGSAAFIGDSIGTWVDQSKSGKNATQNTSPRYPTLVTSSYNGRPAVFFNANGWLTNTSFTGMAHRSGQMTIVALRFIGQDNGPILEGGANGNGFPVSHASTKTIYAGSYNYSLATYNGRYTEGLLLGVLWNSTNGSTNADRLKIFINGVEDTFSTHSGTVPFSSGIQTAGYNIGGASYTSEKINAEVYAVIHMRRAPTKAQLDSVFTYLREKYFAIPSTKSLIVCEGNSITEGYPNQLSPDQGSAWPAFLAKHLDSANYYSPSGTPLWTFNALKEYTVKNVGARGETISTMSGQAASQVDGRRDEMKRNITVFAAGTNDLSAIAVGGPQRDAVQVYTDYATYCTNRRNAGSKVVAVTILDRNDQGAYQSTFDNKRDSVNTYLRANWRSFADALADVDADPRLDDASDATHFYTGDQVHLEDTGCYVYAEVVRNAIRTITDVSTTAFENPMTTAGDLIVGGTLGIPIRLGVGTNGQVLTSNGTSIVWGAGGSGYTNLTSFTSQTAHRLFYSDGSGDVQELAFGSSGQYLKSNGTTSAPSWDTPAGGGGGGITTVGTFSGSAQTDGATISGSTITFGPASATVPGMVGTSAQSWAGNKTFTGRVFLADGTFGSGGAPSLSFTNDNTTGFALTGTNLVFTNQNQAIYIINTAAMRMRNSIQINWASGDPTSNGADVGFVRDASGVVRTTNGSTGYGNLTTKQIIIGSSGTFATSATAALHIYNGTDPSASITDGVLLYSTGASAELTVRDEAGNITTLSPHNFGRIPGGKSEPLAWSYNSQKGGQYIAADMALALRTIEQLTQRVAELEALVKGKKGKTVKIIHTGKIK